MGPIQVQPVHLQWVQYQLGHSIYNGDNTGPAGLLKSGQSVYKGFITGRPAHLIWDFVKLRPAHWEQGSGRGRVAHWERDIVKLGGPSAMGISH